METNFDIPAVVKDPSNYDLQLMIVSLHGKVNTVITTQTITTTRQDKHELADDKRFETIQRYAAMIVFGTLATTLKYIFF